MVKIVEATNNPSAAEYFALKLVELIDEVYGMDDSIQITGDLQVQEMAEKLHRHVKNKLRK